MNDNNPFKYFLIGAAAIVFLIALAALSISH